MAIESDYLRRARTYEGKMVHFLRALIAIPSESTEEGKVIERIRREMESTNAFDTIQVDKLGNLLGYVGKPGKNKKLIAIDAHVDTVGVGDRSEWKHDPYQGKVESGRVWGRGAGDQEGAVPAMVYAAKIMRDLQLDLSEYCLLMTFTVMEEDCDGLCWQYLVNEEKITPDAVVVTDSTNCHILRGHRGRMEIGVTCKGKSCHGSMPEKGDNAVYKIAKVTNQIEKLNKRLRTDPFLGKGTITVSYVDCKTPSLCAVPAEAYIHLDRRLTVGDTRALGRGRGERCREARGCQSARRGAPLRSPQLYRARVPDGEVLPDLVRGGRCVASPSRGEGLPGDDRQDSHDAPVDIQHERRVDCRNVWNSLCRLRTSARERGPYGP